MYIDSTSESEIEDLKGVILDMKNNDLEKARRYFQICFELRNKLKEMQASDTLWAQIISKKKEKGIQGEEQRYQAVIAILDILNNSETEEISRGV